MDGHADEVHVWYARGNETPDAHAFVRRVLATYTGTAPDDLVLEAAPCLRCGELHGKPFLAGHEWLRFNLSHSADLVAVAVSDQHDVGIDVQIVKEKTRTDAVAARFFSADEHEYLAGLAGDSRREAFFLLWARKEACLKATGEGLTGGLSSITVSGPAGESRSIERDGVALTVVDLHAGPAYAGAVAAVGAGDWRVVEREGV